MLDLMNSAQTFLSEPEGRPLREEARAKLRAAINRAMALVREIETPSSEKKPPSSSEN